MLFKNDLFLDVLSLCRCSGLLLAAAGAAVCSVQASPCRAFSYRRAQATGHASFRSRGSQALEHQLRSCGSMWDLPRPGIEPVSPVLAGRFFITETAGKPLYCMRAQSLSGV